MGELVSQVCRHEGDQHPQPRNQRKHALENEAKGPDLEEDRKSERGSIWPCLQRCREWKHGRERDLRRLEGAGSVSCLSFSFVER